MGVLWGYHAAISISYVQDVIFKCSAFKIYGFYCPSLVYSVADHSKYNKVLLTEFNCVLK